MTENKQINVLMFEWTNELMYRTLGEHEPLLIGILLNGLYPVGTVKYNCENSILQKRKERRQTGEVKQK